MDQPRIVFGVALMISIALYVGCRNLIPVGIFLVLATLMAGVHFGQEVAGARVVETAQSRECAGMLSRWRKRWERVYPI